MAYSRKARTFLQVTVLCLLIHLAIARPGELQEYGDPRRTYCKGKSESEIEVCQRCAKHTKSTIVYPMCCENIDDAFNWCDKYINYGKQA